MQGPGEIVSNVTILIITLGAADFLEFLGAFFIVTIVSMCFRLYVHSLWVYIQETSEELSEKLTKYWHKRKKIQKEHSIFDKNNELFH